MLDSIKLNITAIEKFSDDEFFKFCQDNSDLRIERNQNREIFVISSTGSKSGLISAEVLRQLANWTIENGAGLAFDSSTGFTLPDNSVFSPDASWVSKKAWNSLTENQQEKFAPICPEFIVEIRSASDSISQLKEKMESWIKNGIKLGFLIDPISKNAFYYRQKGRIEEINTFDGKLLGEDILIGFELDLSRLLF